MEKNNEHMDTELRGLTLLFHEIQGMLKHAMRKEFEKEGITMPQGMVIGTLFRKGPCKISDLSAALSLSNSTISGIVDRLELQNMVMRERSVEDRRVVVVRLTRTYEEIHHNFHKKTATVLREIFQKADPDDVRNIYQGLKALRKCLAEGLSAAEKNQEEE